MTDSSVACLRFLVDDEKCGKGSEKLLCRTGFNCVVKSLHFRVLKVNCVRINCYCARV